MSETAAVPADRRAAEERVALDRTWSRPAGLYGRLCAADHKTIGIRYLVTAFGFFMLAGLLAAAMRLQLSRPENAVLGPDAYNQAFTTHGTIMMFLFAVPIMQGLGVYLVPLMVGTREIAFPRLNAFSYWVYLFGGLMLIVAFALDIGPDAGWFAYVPLSGPEYSPGKRTDFWAQMITFTELASLAVAVQLITTIFKQRAPGMSLNRMPVFVWAQLVTSFMVVFAMPSVMAASSFLIMDRLVSTHFFNPAEGGDALLWQHLFWFFGHPEVYIIFIPATGVVSELIPAFARRPIFGYPAVVLSLVATSFLGFGLWVHHMFATGIAQLGASFFTGASMMIAIPSGVQIFCWIATLWDGRPVFRTPLLFVIGFIVIFVLGGLTGVMLASVPLDLQVHDTYFVVAHFHYVLLGGAVFPLFAGFYYWFPKVTGRMLSETAGQVAVLAVFHRLQRHVLPDAHPRAARDAAPRLYLPCRPRLGHAEPDRQPGRRRDRRQRRRFPRQCRGQPAPRRDCRRQSVGSVLARMGHLLAAAALQFRRDPVRHRARSAVGRARRAAGRDRIAQRQARGPDHASQRRRAGPPAGISGTVDLAAARRDRGDRIVHRLDLHALGRADRRGAGGGHADRLVLAESSRAETSRA